ncbi:MAG TPA: hypothetical protein PKE57_13095, partial [Cellvibrionaceae bacterium]|nr:hypothetical protein [Cellvibrionaceae bacterium]
QHLMQDFFINIQLMKSKILTYRPGLWVLTGTLQLGNQEDSNGRISYARLIMDKRDRSIAPTLPSKPSTAAR